MIKKLDPQIARLAKKAIPIEAIFDKASEETEHSGIYIVFRNGRPAYVGETSKSLRQRLIGHKNDKYSLLGKFLNLVPDEFSACVVDNEFKQRLELCGDEELELIKALRPEFNKDGLAPENYTGETRNLFLRCQEASKQYESYLKKYRQFEQLAWEPVEIAIIAARVRAYKSIEEASNQFASGKLSIEDAKPVAIKAIEYLIERLNEIAKTSKEQIIKAHNEIFG